jgi:ubiquitin-protein ligase E3 C
VPLSSLAELSFRLPLSFIQLLSPQNFLRSLSTESKVHLVANLLAFTPPRYTKIPVAAFEAYVSLLTTILDALPVNALEPPSVSSSKSWSNEADSDDGSTRVEIVESFSKREPLPNLDPKTLKRLQTLTSDDHLKTLLTTHTRVKDNLFVFLVSLCIVWPGRADKVLSAVASGGTLVRELYRGYVRSSPLGRDDSPGTLMGETSSAVQWLTY